MGGVKSESQDDKVEVGIVLQLSSSNESFWMTSSTSYKKLCWQTRGILKTIVGRKD